MFGFAANAEDGHIFNRLRELNHRLTLNFKKNIILLYWHKSTFNSKLSRIKWKEKKTRYNDITSVCIRCFVRLKKMDHTLRGSIAAFFLILFFRMLLFAEPITHWICNWGRRLVALRSEKGIRRLRKVRAATWDFRRRGGIHYFRESRSLLSISLRPWSRIRYPATDAGPNVPGFK